MCDNITEFLENIFVCLFNDTFVYTATKKLWLTQSWDQELKSLTLKTRKEERKHKAEVKGLSWTDLCFITTTGDNEFLIVTVSAVRKERALL